MKRPLNDGWRGMGDCSCCRHRKVCREGCDAHDEYLNRMAKRALLMEHEKRQEELFKGPEKPNA